MVVLVTKWFGSFLVDQGRVQAERRFPTDPPQIAKRLRAIRQGVVLEEERALAQAGMEVLDPRLRSLGRLNEKTPFFDLGVPEPDASLLHAAALLVGREESKEAAGERDRAIAHSVKAMDEITTTVNTLVERIREWYALHFPEALVYLPEGPKLVEALAKDARPEAIAKAFPQIKAQETIGAELADAQREAIQGFAQSLAGLYAQRTRLEKLVASEARAIAPSLAGVVGDVIAAKLISSAGSLERLANLPASTVQTLGAEGALFQHLKDGKKPPKHGLIFQHGLINTAPWWQRGKMSRLLAGAASLAARLDYFQTPPTDRSAPLVEHLEKQVARVKKDHKAPRPKAPRENKPWRERKAQAAQGRRR
jgi:nucleolar protein 56